MADQASTGQLITSLIVGAGGFAGIAAVVNAVFSRRKTAAEAGGIDANAVRVISDAAASLVQPMEARIQAMEAEQRTMRGELAALRAREGESERRERDHVSKLHEFADWCAVAWKELSDHNIVIREPPMYRQFPKPRPPSD